MAAFRSRECGDRASLIESCSGQKAHHMSISLAHERRPNFELALICRLWDERLRPFSNDLHAACTLYNILGSRSCALRGRRPILPQRLHKSHPSGLNGGQSLGDALARRNSLLLVAARSSSAVPVEGIISVCLLNCCFEGRVDELEGTAGFIHKLWRRLTPIRKKHLTILFGLFQN